MSAFSEANSMSSSQELEESPLLTAEQAASKMSKALGLTSAQGALLTREIEECSDDPILIVVPDDAWIVTHGQALCNQVLDFISTWPKLPQQRRRDIRLNHLAYHFAEFSHILECQRALKNVVPAAFAFSQAAIADLIALNAVTANQAQALPQIGFGRVGVVQKINIRDSDAAEFPEFFMK